MDEPDREWDRLYRQVLEIRLTLESALDKAERHREWLVESMLGVIDAWKTGDDLRPAMTEAMDTIATMRLEGFFEQIPPWLKKEQVRRWIDATGAAPPGVDPDLLASLEEEPRPTPVKHPGRRA